jgi:branched-chain amino acid transport system substrate-binding protein
VLLTLTAACSEGDGDTSTSASSRAPTTAADVSGADEAPVPGPELSQSTSAPAGEPSTTASTVVPIAACPPEALAEPAADAPIVLGFVGPRSGALASFGAVADGLAAGLRGRSVGGHPVELRVEDVDPSDAVGATAAAERLVAGGATAIVADVSMVTAEAVRVVAERTCTPQLGVASPGIAVDPVAHPWTTSATVDAVEEVAIWQAIGATKDAAPLGVVLLAGPTADLQAAQLGGASLVVHANDVALDAPLTAMLAGADGQTPPTVLVVATQGPFCTQAVSVARRAGFAGPIVLGSGCASPRWIIPVGVDPTFVGEIVTFGVRKDPAVTPWATDPAVVAFARNLERAAPGVSPATDGVGLGYDTAFVVMRTLRGAERAGSLSRASIMESAWSVDVVAPLSLPETRVDLDALGEAGGRDTAIVEAAELRTWDVATQRFQSTGERVAPLDAAAADSP